MASTVDPARRIFVSDVHLYFGGDGYQAQFVAFLDQEVAGAAELYIHGDLFDFWVGPKQGRLSFYGPLFSSLRRLVDAGTAVTLLHGNRDYLIGRCFEDVGVRVLRDDAVLELGGQRVHLSHGDAFCIHDRSYQFWARGVLRARPIRFVVRNLPVRAGIGLARTYRRISARKAARSAARSRGRLPTILDGVTRLVSEDPFDVVICGHIHHLAETHIPRADGGVARLLTTGAWEEAPNYVESHRGSFRLRRRGASGTYEVVGTGDPASPGP